MLPAPEADILAAESLLFAPKADYHFAVIVLLGVKADKPPCVNLLLAVKAYYPLAVYLLFTSKAEFRKHQDCCTLRGKSHTARHGLESCVIRLRRGAVGIKRRQECLRS